MISMDMVEVSVRDSRREQNVSYLSRAIDRTYQKLARGHKDPNVMARWELRLVRQEKELGRLCRRGRTLLGV